MERHPARELLLETTRMYPNAWSNINLMLEKKEVLQWPDWCFIPLDGWVALADVIAGKLNAYDADGFDFSDEIALLKLGNTLAALGTWRMTQGIYRFDKTLYDELISTPISGEIPTEVLFNLPEWCVYVETPDFSYGGLVLEGFWAFLEFDHKNKRPELRLMLLTEDGYTVPSILHLDQEDLKDAINAVHQDGFNQVERFGIDKETYKEVVAELTDATTHFLSRALSLLLYICSQNDFAHNQHPDVKPSMPEPKKTKRGMRYFPASTPTTWDVGVRMGAALRRVRTQDQGTQGDGPGQEVKRPHIRRAHWHTFLTGPRKTKDGKDIPAEQRTRVLRWIPPIAVNVGDMNELESLPSVIRPVDIW